MARISGLDYGLKRIGIAVTDTMQIIASPLQTIENHKIIEFLKQYFSKESVESIVLGLPKHLNNQEAEMTAEVLKFKTQLETHFPEKTVYLLDERFTSKIAMQMLVASGMKKQDRKQKGNLDKMSASILLQDFLDSRK